MTKVYLKVKKGDCLELKGVTPLLTGSTGVFPTTAKELIKAQASGMLHDIIKIRSC